MTTRQEEYDKFYTDNPEKWADSKRNVFAYGILKKHFEEPPRSFIDIGCGNGHTIQYFSKIWPGAKAYGLDLSPVAINLAKRKVPQGEFIISNLEDCSEPPTCDLVMSLGVFEHFENINVSLKKLKQFVGNLMYVEVPNCIGYSGSEKKEGYRRLNRGNRQMEWHLYRETWEKFFRNNGYRIVDNIFGPSVYTEFIWVLAT